ncbi:MAG: PorP/SprF family type IX secretion system membrane protein, partial [Bacteroidales bacterium]|nr:PorP/SprF family type IX secretion system membrane protein [Bacteroidales bacterium]
TNDQCPIRLLSVCRSTNLHRIPLRLLLFLIMLLIGNVGKSQDALFTNYLNTPMQTNPALVAFDNDLKISLNYRGRISRLSQSYNMPALSIVYPLINQEKSKRWGGLGFSVLSDMSGNSQMIKTTGASLAFAYNIQISDIQFISASLGAGYYRRQVNLNNLSTCSQYVPNQGFDPTIPINESFTSETKGYLDLSTGMVWQLTDKQGNNRAFVGISAFHLNQPDISLNEIEDALPFRYGLQLGYRVFSSSKINIFPDAGLDYQAEILRYNLGVNIKILFKGLEQGYLQDASISFRPRYLSDNLASIGLELRKPDYVISFTYDFNVSNRPVNSNIVDAYEVYLGFKKTLFKPNQKKEKIIVDDQYIVGEERLFNKNNEVIVLRDTVYLEDTSKIVEKEWSEKLSDPERKITFNYKSDKVENEAKDVLDEIITYLKANRDYVIEIEGHTDNIGETESNKRHSLRRAQAISNYLVKQGILPSRIRVRGKGEGKPIATNATEEGRAKNRRVEFRLYRIIK